MKNVIQPLLISTILGLVGCSGKEALEENQTTYVAAEANVETSASNATASINNHTETGYTSVVKSAGSDDPITLKIDNSEVSINELESLELAYEVKSDNQSDYDIDVISYDEEIIHASVENNKIVLNANSVDTPTYVNLDVVVSKDTGKVSTTIPVEVIPLTKFSLNLAQTELQMNFLDTFYIPFNIDYDGSDEIALSIEDVEGSAFATVELESTNHINNNLIIQGKGIYKPGVLSFNVVATTENGTKSVPVSVGVYPEVDIDIDLSDDAPTFNKADSSFTIVRVCSEVSDDYEIEVTEISGNENVTATLEGSVITITSSDIQQDTNATFMVTASLLGTTETAYFDVLVTAE